MLAVSLVAPCVCAAAAAQSAAGASHCEDNASANAVASAAIEAACCCGAARPDWSARTTATTPAPAAALAVLQPASLDDPRGLPYIQDTFPPADLQPLPRPPAFAILRV